MTTPDRSRRPPPAPPSQPTPFAPFDPNTPLLHFSAGDPWTFEDAFQGTQIFGATGSGKTSGSGATLAMSFLAHGFGGLVCCAKPEERQLWERYARAAGRTDDLLIFSPEQPWRFNFLDYELRRQGRGGGKSENLVSLFATVREIVGGKVSMQEEGSFWESAVRELLRNAVDLFGISGHPLTLADLSRMVIEAPRSEQEASDPAWQARSLLVKILDEAEQRRSGPVQEHDFRTAERYWGNWAAMDSRLRTSIVATFTSMADILLHGDAWDLLCTETNIVPEISYMNGKIIVLDMPVQEFGETGRIVQVLFKHLWQTAMLRRDATTYPRPVMLWADEAQNFISSFDFRFQSVARSARVATVYLTQNISNYYATLGRGGQHETDSLLGNLQTQIFHANGDVSTNRYASERIGQHETMNFNFGSSSSNQGGSHSGGGSEAVKYKVLPSAFTTLRKGGRVNNGQVDAILFQSGRVFQASGETYLPLTFWQPRSEGS